MKVRRVIDQLRAMFPGRWTYDIRCLRWSHEDGWHVRAEAALAPRYDGDDDSFRTQYRRSDTGELLVLDQNLMGFFERGEDG
jgi:hypothetical protein